MRASSQRKRPDESSQSPDISPPTISGRHQNARSARRGTLRCTPRRVIIRDERLDGEALSPSGRHTLVRAERSAHVDVVPLPAMPDHEAGIDRSRAPADPATSITELLADLRAGRREAFDQILPLVYHELRRAARRELAVRPSDSMSTTALVHELYLKFARAERADWRNRAHFLGVASVAMRHILVDRARRRKAEKRGGPHRHVTLDDELTAVDTQAESLLELH